MLFQTLDDKSQCVGLYADGKLFFEDFPDDLTHTWKITTLNPDKEIQSAWLYAAGAPLSSVAPPELSEALNAATRKLHAYLKAFKLAKINLREHCFFDMVPEDFLLQYCELKNKISENVFENYEKPHNYEHLLRTQGVLQKIKNQKLKLDTSGCKSLFLSSAHRKIMSSILSGDSYIDYNLFGTVTGRLTTVPDSFPILTLKKGLRKIIKPHNDWFVSLDYNGAEIRTLLALSGQQQPETDIHTWNIENVFNGNQIDREEAKTKFFSWLYNPDSSLIETEFYDREKVVDSWYSGTEIRTPFERRIKVDQRKALNYLIQSTTADLVLDRAVEIDKFLQGRKSFISHIVHDEIVIDMSADERDIIPAVKSIFSNNRLASYMVNLKCGMNYFDLSEFNI